jgi:hypothetical protein
MPMRPGLRPLSGEHLRYSKFGKTCKLALRAQTAHFLIQISPFLEPAALIGAHGHGMRSGAKRGIADVRCLANLAYGVCNLN